MAVAAFPVQDADDPDVFWFSVGTLDELIVPEEMLLAFKLVRDAPDPLNVVAVSNPDEELKVKLLPVLGFKLPDAAVANTGKQVVSDDSSPTVMVVAIAAVPEVFWFPLVLTPGRFIFADPSKLTPPIFLAVVSVAADPVVF